MLRLGERQTGNATAKLLDGEQVIVDGTAGKVYPGVPGGAG